MSREARDHFLPVHLRLAPRLNFLPESTVSMKSRLVALPTHSIITVGVYT
jgi:hypothetical protein